MRAFIAIELPKDVRKRIYEFGLDLPGKVSRVAEENIHITLQFLGDISDETASDIIDEIKTVNEGRFTAEANGTSYFGGHEIRAVFAKIIDSGKISRIYLDLEARLAARGIKAGREEAYVPHATIARIKRGNAEIKAFISQNAAHNFGRFDVTSICLRKSVLTEKGSVYSTMYEHFLRKV